MLDSELRDEEDNSWLQEVPSLTCLMLYSSFLHPFPVSFLIASNRKYRNHLFFALEHISFGTLVYFLVFTFIKNKHITEKQI